MLLKLSILALHIKVGVSQGSVIGPVLYQLFTYGLPTTEGFITGTFADDTAVITLSVEPKRASDDLQIGLDRISNWLNNWRLKAKEMKSTQVTFTTRKETCL